MKFDPTKKFGMISGISASYPGARYEQKGFIFDAHHKCLNPKEAKELSEVDLVADATKKLMAKKSAELAELVLEIVSAQAEVAETGAAGAKGKLTKLTKKHDLLVAEIESMDG